MSGLDAFLASSWAGILAIAFFALGSAAAVGLTIATEDSPLKGVLKKYEDYLEGFTRFLLMQQSGKQIARIQVAAFLMVAVASGLFREPLLAIAAIMILVLPPVVLKRRVDERVLRLEQQLDGWLLMLSNALKATPSIGESIRSTVNLVQAPFSEELDLMVKENALGTPIDQAILNTSERVGSAVVSGALATLVIARQTGGDLPRILESSAASLREMARLEGVVRTKTAEGKGQVLVLAVMPFLMVGLLSWVDETWLEPLTGNFIGYIIVAVATTLWLVAIFWARKILDVDV